MVDIDYQKKYRETHKEYYKQKIKEWKEKNKDKTKEYNKDYYAKNKEKAINYQLQPVFCKYCNREYKRSQMSTHIRTNKHIKNKDEFEQINELKEY